MAPAVYLHMYSVCDLCISLPARAQWAHPYYVVNLHKLWKPEAAFSTVWFSLSYMCKTLNGSNKKNICIDQNISSGELKEPNAPWLLLAQTVGTTCEINEDKLLSVNLRYIFLKQ